MRSGRAPWARQPDQPDLWLGHEQAETAQIYLHADMAIKQRALDRTTPPTTKPGRYQPGDTLLTFLDNL